MSAAPKLNRYPPEAYLEYETVAQAKSEYYDGKVVPLAGASLNHNRITRNLLVLLTTLLKEQPFEVFMSGMRVWIPQRKAYTYPDMTVIAGEPLFYDQRDDTITNPFLIIEVLSETTESYDRGEKFVGYRTIPSLQEYILIAQNRLHVEQFVRTTGNKWLLSDYHDESNVIPLSWDNCQLPMHAIYERVVLQQNQML